MFVDNYKKAAYANLYNDSPFWYQHYDSEHSDYIGRVNAWLAKEFANTSSAPRNDLPWFIDCVIKAFDSIKVEDPSDDVMRADPVLIGICGEAGAGKDSAVSIFDSITASVFDSRFEINKMSFASPLKQIAEIFGFTKTQLTDRTAKEAVDPFWGISPRKFLQMTGTEMFRNVWRKDCWTRLAQRQIEGLSPLKTDVAIGGARVFGEDGNVVTCTSLATFITDVRFPNEIEFIKGQGGIVVHIERPDNPFRVDGTHESERYMRNTEDGQDGPIGDVYIVNNASSAEEWSLHFLAELCRSLKQDCFYT